MNSEQTKVLEECLCCPETKSPLKVISQNEIPLGYDIAPMISERLRPFATRGMHSYMITSDESAAYPIIDDIPILLSPEKISLNIDKTEFRYDLASPIYREAYEEMDYYNRVCCDEANNMSVAAVNKMFPNGQPSADELDSFPQPEAKWLDATYDALSQLDAYNNIRPVRNKAILQVGGKGIHAIKCLIAGASQAWLLTPMIGEAVYAKRLAALLNCQDKLYCAVGIAEEAPFKSDLFHAIYSGGCVHHFVLAHAMPELRRILTNKGKLVAVDPWKAPFYTIGTTIFGQREKEVKCKPLDSTRLSPFFASFEEAEVVHHGALSRYFLLALDKIGLTMGLTTATAIMRLDDWFCDTFSCGRDYGSSVCLIGKKDRRNR
jgi:uncharacterized protein YbaR (Trm112 family)/SAM-dependent methyltransferase